MAGVIFELIGRHPAAILIVGGILLLLLSGLNANFAGWGWALIIFGVIPSHTPLTFVPYIVTVVTPAGQTQDVLVVLVVMFDLLGN